jgi:hypothetical protein
MPISGYLVQKRIVCYERHMKFDAVYLKANDPITKRAFWIREQRMNGQVWRWAVLTSPEWAAPKIWMPEMGLTQTVYWENPGTKLRIMPSWMYYLPVPTKYESPHWNGRVSGTLQLPDGELWQVTHWPAQQGHLWGWRPSKEWAWAHGNCFVEDHTAAFEILTSGGRTVLCLQSQRFNFLANTCATWRCTRHEITPTHWNWTFTHKDLTIAGQFRLGYAEMAHIDYPTPQGDTRHCANTKVGEGIIEVTRSGQPILQLTAHDTLAWEFVRKGASQMFSMPAV